MSNLLNKIKSLFERIRVSPSTVEGAFGNSAKPAGTKLGRLAFEGNLGLRGRTLGGAARLAQQGKWPK